MSHEDVIRRALADRLAQYEGNDDATRQKSRELFLDDTTDFIIRLVVAGTPDLLAECQVKAEDNLLLFT